MKSNMAAADRMGKTSPRSNYSTFLASILIWLSI